ncbi:tyrosinase cofactor [Streptomyces kunmingensis]|uniref:Tyrosinase cofactor n=1 Tax=Streptomyces kunmingensis TaxID=68225 RepID=A0ABU6C4K2_9ACTN|nr:tyrosinase cofactor [Streptomyces kunmingensis]MEB3959647.1 tyrosinase cofactor [Streptomyces kunmingensis]
MNPEMFLTRRSAALILLGAASTATAVARLRSPAEPDPEPERAAGADPDSFEETYLGRRVRGIRSPGEAGTWQVTVDGRPLHLMRRADGTYLSMVDHYDSYASPLAAARGAVAELGDQALRTHEGRPGPARDRKV